MKRWLALSGGALLVLAALLYDVRRVELQADITSFVPELREQTELEIVRALSRAPAGRLVATTLGGADAQARRQAARTLQELLAEDAHFAWATTGSGLGSAEQRAEGGFTTTLFAHRFGLMDVPLEDGRIPDAELERRAEAMYRALATPLGSVLRPLLARDPLFAFGDLLTRLRESAGSAVTDAGGVWETADGSRTLVLAVARADALSGAGQRGALTALREALAQVKQAHPGLTADSTSVGHYAVGAEKVIRGDIQRISTWSTVGIVVLYLWAFRSLRWPLVVLLPLGCGVAVALCGVALIFGPVHGMALAFGAGLLGVAVDYAAHFFVHRASDPERSAEQVMKRVFPGVALGACTTLVGVSAFIATPSAGFRQMGTLAALGIGVALLATRFVLPALTGRAPRSNAGLEPLIALGGALRSRPRLARTLTVVALLPALAGLSRAHWDDDVRKLRPELPEVEAESQRVREALGRKGDHDRFVVAVGTSDDAALRRAEQAATHTREALAAEGSRPTAGLGALRAPSRQREVLEALRSDPTLQARLDRALSAQGFSPDAFEPLSELLTEAPGPLEPATVLEASWGKPWALSRVPLPGQRVAYTVAVPPGHEDTVAAAVAELEDVYYVDPPAVMSEAYGSFREQAWLLFGVGLSLVWVVLFARYRALYPAFACWLSAVLSCAAALGAQALWGIAFNPLHLLGVLLVASMAVDYSVYQLEANDGPSRPVALASAALAAITTCLSLGLLGTSQLPALSAIGLTAALGVGFAFLCATVVATLKEAG